NNFATEPVVSSYFPAQNSSLAISGFGGLRQSNRERQNRKPLTGGFSSGAMSFKNGFEKRVSYTASCSSCRATSTRPMLIGLSAITPNPTHRFMPSSPL